MISNNNATKHVLENKHLSIKVQTRGAELASVKSSDKEYIWQANPDFWARHAPILFPIVGRLIDNEYIYQGKKYSMKQHGFARDNDFELIKKSNNSITLELTETQISKEIFPFVFKLQVKYTLVDTVLKIEYTVMNPSQNEDLYFSIGAHPAFNCPFEPEHQRNEYQLIFDKEVQQESENILSGFRTSETAKVFQQNGKLILDKTIFDNDALIFNPNPFSKVVFVHEPTQKKYLSVTFNNYPFLGIWSSHKDAPFICIEPWHGITDHKSHTKELSEKEGIVRLVPDEIFHCEFAIEVL